MCNVPCWRPDKSPLNLNHNRVSLLYEEEVDTLILQLCREDVVENEYDMSETDLKDSDPVKFDSGFDSLSNSALADSNIESRGLTTK